MPCPPCDDDPTVETDNLTIGMVPWFVGGPASAGLKGVSGLGRLGQAVRVARQAGSFRAGVASLTLKSGREIIGGFKGRVLTLSGHARAPKHDFSALGVSVDDAITAVRSDLPADISRLVSGADDVIRGEVQAGSGSIGYTLGHSSKHGDLILNVWPIQ